MALPSILWAHDGISEREVAHRWPGGAFDNAAWEDCTWDSALMWYRLSYDDSRPSTHYEAERLRQASGEDTHSGSNPFDIVKGIRTRYGREVAKPIQGWSVLRIALGVGYNGLVSGSMGAFPWGHRLRRPQPGFASWHAVHVAKVDAAPRYWVTNPLFPEDHDGEWWTEDELRRFVQAGERANLWHLVAKIRPRPATTPPPAAYVPETVRVRSGAFWRYVIAGTRSAGYTVTRDSKPTSGFSAKLGKSRIDTRANPAFPSGTWGGRRRIWAKVVDAASAYNGVWLDLLEGSNITVTK